MAYQNPTGTALRQGDILRDVKVFAATKYDDDERPVGELRTYLYSIVMTQDCDLEQDFKARFPEEKSEESPDKLLLGILLCGVYDENALKAGMHRERAKKFSGKEWKPVTQNNDPRYQFLGYVPQLNKTVVADFKDFFLVPCELLYNEMQERKIARLAQMETPYKEHTLQRFAWYLMRIGLPLPFHQLQANTGTELNK